MYIYIYTLGDLGSPIVDQCLDHVHAKTAFWPRRNVNFLTYCLVEEMTWRRMKFDFVRRNFINSCWIIFSTTTQNCVLCGFRACFSFMYVVFQHEVCVILCKFTIKVNGVQNSILFALFRSLHKNLKV